MKENFTDFFSEAVHPDWSDRYFDYASLKCLLKAFNERRVNIRRILNEGHDNVSTFGALHDENFELVYHELRPSHAVTGQKYKFSCSQTDVSLSIDEALVSATEIGALPVQGCQSECQPYQNFLIFGNNVNNEDRVLSNLAKRERYEFASLLDSELKKAIDFYHSELDNMKGRTDGLLVQIIDAENSNSRDALLLQDLRYLTRDYLLLYAFICVNVVTFRQSLVRHDALVTTFGGLPVSQWYIVNRRRRNSVILDTFLHHKELQSSIKLTLSIMKKMIQKLGHNGSDSRDIIVRQNEFFHKRVTLDMNSLDATLSETILDEKSVNNYRSATDHMVLILREYFVRGSYIGVDLSVDALNAGLKMKGSVFNKAMKFLGDFRKTELVELMTDCQDSANFVFMEEEDKNDQYSVFFDIPLLCNFFSTFAYTANFYVVGPSSTKYTNCLGGQDALAGLLIGAMPFASLVSSIFFSAWTNRSYKAPLIFAGVLMSIGNLFYATAYREKSILMAISGRAISGLGSPRIISKRYIADTASMSTRTAVCAFFATGSAMGTAFGPALAILMDLFDFDFDFPLFGKVYINSMTGPGYIFFIVWTLLTIAIIFFFREPQRKGLLEQMNKKKEIKSDLSKTSLLVADANDEISTLRSQYDFPRGDDNKPSQVCSCFYSMTIPVWVCMFLILCNKLTSEGLISASSVITTNRYSWDVNQVAFLGLGTGLLVVPVSIFVGWLSFHYEDRILMTFLFSIAASGFLLMIDFSDFRNGDNSTYNEGEHFAIGPRRYIFGTVLSFSMLHACESVIMSIFSKVIPVKLAIGTFNSGLLSNIVATVSIMYLCHRFN
uniref:SPX domain-containing protein n=1 Tax=Corethron hystrix TaxID=216773 RepID=A0A7S1BPB7_9STRA|mmetsp:Transcript_36021/g.84101  ORF Transcript_36021/g.84101 Transcript_36021/m.84101 type:complete len:835 (+) Transcript_36021:273-2777(+)